MLIAMAGLPASGKSTLGRRLARELPATLLDKDALRGCLFDGTVDYSAAQNDLVVDVAFRVAAYLIGRRPDACVVVDGRTFSEARQVDALRRAAADMATPLRIVECRCSEGSARARLERDAGVHPAADRDFAMWTRRRATAVPIEGDVLRLDTDALTLERCVRLALDHVRGGAPA